MLLEVKGKIVLRYFFINVNRNILFLYIDLLYCGDCNGVYF